MRYPALLLPLLVAVLLPGCYEARSSSRTALAKDDSEWLLVGNRDDAARRLSEQFGRRGFSLVDRRRGFGGGELLTLSGRRTTLSNGGSYVAPSGQVVNTAELTDVGSYFYVLLSTEKEGGARDGVTRAVLHGKPTLNGLVVCSDQDPKWVPRGCKQGYLGWGGTGETSGLAEAQVIRGVLMELELLPAGEPGTLVPGSRKPRPVQPEPRCVASELPEWEGASAVEKRRLMEQCRAPASPTTSR